jgi:hypothetical protein
MSSLPKEFVDLQRFIADGWARPSEHARLVRRVSSSVAEIKDFYETLLPRMEAIVQYLDRHPLDGVPENDRPLLYLALAFMDVAPSWEMYKAPDVPEPAYDIERMHIVDQPYPWETERSGSLIAGFGWLGRR